MEIDFIFLKLSILAKNNLLFIINNPIIFIGVTGYVRTLISTNWFCVYPSIFIPFPPYFPIMPKLMGFNVFYSLI